MKQHVICKIHNSSLGSVQMSYDENEAKDIVRGMAEEQFGRALTDEEIDDLNDKLEILNDEDPDNIYCFSIGILD